MFVLALTFLAPFLGHFIAPFISLCDTFICQAKEQQSLILSLYKNWHFQAKRNKKIPICLSGLVFHYVFFTQKMLAHDLMGSLSLFSSGSWDFMQRSSRRLHSINVDHSVFIASIISNTSPLSFKKVSLFGHKIRWL